MGRLTVAVLIVAILGGAVAGPVHAQINKCPTVDGKPNLGCSKG